MSVYKKSVRITLTDSLFRRCIVLFQLKSKFKNKVFIFLFDFIKIYLHALVIAALIFIPINFLGFIVLSNIEEHSIVGIEHFTDNLIESIPTDTTLIAVDNNTMRGNGSGEYYYHYATIVIDTDMSFEELQEYYNEYQFPQINLRKNNDYDDYAYVYIEKVTNHTIQPQDILENIYDGYLLDYGIYDESDDFLEDIYIENYENTYAITIFSSTNEDMALLKIFLPYYLYDFSHDIFYKAE